MSIATSRPIAVLGVVSQHVGALAGQVPAPQIGEALGYLGQLVGYAAREVDREARLREHEDALAKLETRAADMFAEHSIEVAEADRFTRLLVGLTVATARHVPGAEELHREAIAVVSAIEHGSAQGGSAAAASAAAGSAPSPEDLSNALTEYMRKRLGDPAVRVQDVRQITGGFSKITTLFTSTSGGEPEAIALRQVPPGLVDPALVPEFEVLRQVWTPEQPIPEPLWVEPEVNDLGGPFFASRQARGSNLGTVMGPTQAVPESVCLELAEFLGQLHSTDPSALERTPVPPMRTSEEIEQAIAAEERDSIGTAQEPLPLLADLFAWLRAHAPQRTERPVIVHGDLGWHNVLVEDGHLTAVLDWERSHVGDPAEDLVYLRPSVEAVFPWDRFLERYAEAGGHVHDDVELDRFYEVWKEVWRCAQCISIAADFDRGDTRLPAAIAGCLLSQHFLEAGMRAAHDPIRSKAGSRTP
jgi:aminoglycoside phosphotransferase (APT) family kinase protein